MVKITRDRKIRRKRRVSPNVHGTAERPRINVYRSSQHIYAQAIDDVNRVTLAAFTDQHLKDFKGTKSEKSKEVGKQLAARLLEKKVKVAIFDRSSYTYDGRVKALAEGVREGGVQM